MKFSIITVTYNAVSCLQSTIKSISGQVGADIEYIVIDGASTDGTVDLIRKYGNKISYWVSEPDKGLYDAMNKGLQKAAGDYVWFINAGDSFRHEEVVREVARVAQQENLPDIIYGETDLVDAEEKYIGKRRLTTPRKLSWKSFRMGMVVCHQAFVMKRDKAPLFDLSYRYAADFDWCIRCMKAADKIVDSQARLVNYVCEGISTQNRKASLWERYRIMQKYYGKLPVLLLHIWFAIRFYWAKRIRGIA